ncbi:MAG: hypothetical protein LCH34_00370 [Firmicutes bacterium]|nr:hypothetical protein [Bacillota bacterium]
MHNELLDSVFDELYVHAVSNEYSHYMKTAESFFVLEEDHSDTEGFAEWFIFNYRLNDRNERIIDKYIQQSDAHIDALNAIKRSRRSLYEVRIEREQTVLKDIFNQDDYLVEAPELEEGQVISTRVVTFENKNFLVGDLFTLDKQYLETIRKYILDLYNQHVKTNGLTTLDDFLDQQGHLLYKVLRIVNTIDEENAYDNELMLYQANYAYRCTQEALFDHFMTLGLPVYADEDEEPLLRVIIEDIIIAEIEITNGQFYVLCNNPSHLDQMLTRLKPLEGNEIVFLKTETFTLEDLL